MADLSRIVKSSVSIRGATISRTSFGTPIVVGPHVNWRERTRSYTSLPAVAKDFSASHPIYRAMEVGFSQDERPSIIKVGRIWVAVAKIEIRTIANALGRKYAYLIDDVYYDYDVVASMNQDAVATAMAAEIGALPGFDATASGNVVTVMTSVDHPTGHFSIVEASGSSGVSKIYFDYFSTANPRVTITATDGREKSHFIYLDGVKVGLNVTDSVIGTLTAGLGDVEITVPVIVHPADDGKIMAVQVEVWTQDGCQSSTVVSHTIGGAEDQTAVAAALETAIEVIVGVKSVPVVGVITVQIDETVYPSGWIAIKQHSSTTLPFTSIDGIGGLAGDDKTGVEIASMLQVPLSFLDINGDGTADYTITLPGATNIVGIAPSAGHPTGYVTISIDPDNTGVMAVTVGSEVTACLGEDGDTLGDQWKNGLDAIRAYDAQWYGNATTARAHLTSRQDIDNLEAAIAEWREAQTVFGDVATPGIETVSNGDIDLVDQSPAADTTSLAARLKALGYGRTLGRYSPYAIGSPYVTVTIARPVRTGSTVMPVYSVIIDGQARSYTMTAWTQTAKDLAAALAAVIHAQVATTHIDGVAEETVVRIFHRVAGVPIDVLTGPTNTGTITIATIKDTWEDVAELCARLSYDLDRDTQTWAHKPIKGAIAGPITDTQFNNLLGDPMNDIAGKNWNAYVELNATLSLNLWGICPDGNYADTRIFVDWVNARMQENMAAALASMAKFDFSDADIGVLVNVARNILEIAVGTRGIIRDSARWGTPEGYLITVPKASQISAVDRARRVLGGANAIRWNATYGTPIHQVEIAGELTL